MNPQSEDKARLYALLHDAPEYVMGDIISPFKAAMGGNYKDVENRLLGAIYLHFALNAAPPVATQRLIKKADRESAYHEAVHLAGAQLLVDGQVRGQIAGQTCLDPQHLIVLVGSTSALTQWPPGADEVRLDHLLKLPDGGASLELRTAANELLFRHQYLPETGGAASSWTRRGWRCKPWG